ncbi:MAG: Membrane protein, putative, partial [Marinimicrobia bacterium 46_47]
LYRKDPGVFAASFLRLQPETTGPLWAFWCARFEADGIHAAGEKETHKKEKSISLPILILLILTAGTLVKLPDLTGISETYFYPRFPGFALFPLLSVYLMIRNGFLKTVWISVSILFLISGVYAALLPVYTALLGFAGMILTGITAGLFSLVDELLFESLMPWIAPYGAALCLIGGAHLVFLREKSTTPMAPVIARIFTPLFLFTLLAYLGIVLFKGINPFIDRNTLMVFNAMLLLILAMTVFSIRERNLFKNEKIQDILLTTLLALGLLLDLIALSAILFRLGSYGLSPNRIAILGLNLLIAGHAAGLLNDIIGKIQGKKGLHHLRSRTGRYLTVYAGWAAFMVFIYPLLFRFQ